MGESLSTLRSERTMMQQALSILNSPANCRPLRSYTELTIGQPYLIKLTYERSGKYQQGLGLVLENVDPHNYRKVSLKKVKKKFDASVAKEAERYKREAVKRILEKEMREKKAAVKKTKLAEDEKKKKETVAEGGDDVKKTKGVEGVVKKAIDDAEVIEVSDEDKNLAISTAALEKLKKHEYDSDDDELEDELEIMEMEDCAEEDRVFFTLYLEAPYGESPVFRALERLLSHNKFFPFIVLIKAH